MSSEKRGGGGAVAREAAQDEAAFALQRARLERAVLASCAPDQPWAAGVANAIHAALQFADANPFAARVLTIHAAHRRLEGRPAFTEMVGRFAALMVRHAPETARPTSTPGNVAIRIARQTFLQIESRPKASALEIAPDLIVFALTPYVSFAEAQRYAAVPLHRN